MGGRVVTLALCPFGACFTEAAQDHLLHLVTSLLGVVLPDVLASSNSQFVTALLTMATNAAVTRNPEENMSRNGFSGCVWFIV